MSIQAGALHIVATPIGNLDDLGPRAQAVLAGVDVIAAEDTRHTGALLGHLGIRAEQTSLHEHNEAERIPHLVARLVAGATVALVSDAGTPVLSDPGFRLVVAAHEAGIRVVPVPGPSAITAALSAAGQPTDRFLFAGFPPAKSRARRNWLQDLADQPATLVLFESCHRLARTLADLAAIFGTERPATLCRELTKRYETVHRATLGALVEFVASDPDQRRGEVVLVVAGGTPQSQRSADLATVLDALLPELPPARAAAVAARLTGQPRKVAYRAALEQGESHKPD